ncbi:Mitochondrial distribution and morphology protein 12 [Cercospora zeina]
MSIEINWEALTGGPDGEALAETIRDFIHERFQSIALPKLIRSVAVHKFEFGRISPEIVLKDIGDPLPDFYETDDDASVLVAPHEQDTSTFAEPRHATTRTARGADGARRQSELDLLDRIGSAGLARGTTPGVLGATTNLGYFHLPLSAGLPGTQTPLAAVAGGGFSNGRGPSQPQQQHRHTDSFSSTSPPSLATPTSSQGHAYHEQPPGSAVSDGPDGPALPLRHDHPDMSTEDTQVVFHVTYAGDIKLSLTADVFLDYPMPSFVGIPLKLRITGLTFNGVGILAYIKKRAHLCFLSPEDAEALVGGEQTLDTPNEKHSAPEEATKVTKVGTLLEDIKIESEMGETESGKQVLKNVGKIEKFILEQVQRIFEDEFVYPSFWTFLV